MRAGRNLSTGRRGRRSNGVCKPGHFPKLLERWARGEREAEDAMSTEPPLRAPRAQHFHRRELASWATELHLAYAWASSDKGTADHWTSLPLKRLKRAVLGIQFAQTEPHVLRKLRQRHVPPVGPYTTGILQPKIMVALKGKEGLQHSFDQATSRLGASRAIPRSTSCSLGSGTMTSYGYRTGMGRRNIVRDRRVVAAAASDGRSDEHPVRPHAYDAAATHGTSRNHDSRRPNKCSRDFLGELLA